MVSVSRGVRPILLLDDVSSELDRFRTRALFAYLQQHEGQVFLSTTRPDLLELGGKEGAPRRDFSVRAGTVSELSASSVAPGAPDLGLLANRREEEPSSVK